MPTSPDPRDELPLLIADVFETAGALRRHGDHLAAAAGQTQARWQLLSVLAEGEWTVPRVARRLGITRQSVQRVADALAADGLLATGTNPEHRRSPRLHLTERGREALDSITVEAGQWHAHAASDISARDVATTRRVLQTLIAATR